MCTGEKTVCLLLGAAAAGALIYLFTFVLPVRPEPAAQPEISAASAWPETSVRRSLDYLYRQIIEIEAGTTHWGRITGTLTEQTDLVSYVNAHSGSANAVTNNQTSVVFGTLNATAGLTLQGQSVLTNEAVARAHTNRTDNPHDVTAAQLGAAPITNAEHIGTLTLNGHAVVTDTNRAVRIWSPDGTRRFIDGTGGVWTVSSLVYLPPEQVVRWPSAGGTNEYPFSTDAWECFIATSGLSGRYTVGDFVVHYIGSHGTPFDDIWWASAPTSAVSLTLVSGIPGMGQCSLYFDRATNHVDAVLFATGGYITENVAEETLNIRKLYSPASNYDWIDGTGGVWRISQVAAVRCTYAAPLAELLGNVWLYSGTPDWADVLAGPYPTPPWGALPFTWAYNQAWETDQGADFKPVLSWDAGTWSATVLGAEYHSYGGVTSPGSLVAAEPRLAVSSLMVCEFFMATVTTRVDSVMFRSDLSKLSELVFTPPRWHDVVVSGSGLGVVSDNGPTLAAVLPGSEIKGYSYDVGEYSYFAAQTPHGAASTNTAFPNFFYEPHVHISVPAVTPPNTNVTLVLHWQIAPVLGSYVGTDQYFTNTFGFTVAGENGKLSFGVITNNALQGRDSVEIRGKVTRIVSESDDLGANGVIIDSLDFHWPEDTVGSSAMSGDAP